MSTSTALPVALQREHYNLPTFDDVLSTLKNTGKLDVHEAFLHVRVNEQSNLLTTMITPYGRYRWVCLPFALVYLVRSSRGNLMKL